LTSCGNSDDVIISKEEYDKLQKINISKSEYPKKIKFYDGDGCERKASIIIIDSCEYIERVLYSTSAVLLHKGNCCFCQRRLEETLKIREH
jgi:hypothetical protein